MTLKETLKDIATRYIQLGWFHFRLVAPGFFFLTPALVFSVWPYGLTLHWLTFSLALAPPWYPEGVSDNPNLRKLVSLTKSIHLYFEVRRDLGSVNYVLLPSLHISKDDEGYDISLIWGTAGATLRLGSRTNPTDPSQEGL